MQQEIRVLNVHALMQLVNSRWIVYVDPLSSEKRKADWAISIHNVHQDSSLLCVIMHKQKLVFIINTKSMCELVKLFANIIIY